MVYRKRILLFVLLIAPACLPVCGAEILIEDGPSRVVTGDWAARMARGLAGKPSPTAVPEELIKKAVSQSGLDFLLPYTGVFAQGIQRYGWAQFEQEPEQVPTVHKARIYLSPEDSSPLYIESFDGTDALLLKVTVRLPNGTITVEKFNPPHSEDRSVYVSFLSVEHMVLYQEHFEKQFFESMIDLGRPGLQRVREAYKRKKIALAIYELSEYYRHKESPEALIRNPVTQSKNKINKAAEAICRHEFTSHGITYTYGPEIDWTHHRVKVMEWLWSLNNLNHFITLLNGYLETGNEKYAKEFVTQMIDWVVQNPAPPYTLTRVASWRNLDAGNRCTRSLPVSFYGFLSSPEFTPQAIQLMLGSLWSHGDYLLKHPAGLRRPSNWSVIDSTGLAAVSIYFPELTGADEWRKTGYERLAYQMKLQVYPDGAQWELAPSYHLYCLSRFRTAFDLAQENHFQVPEDFARRLESMYEYLMWISKPDRSVPAFSDSHSSSIRNVLLEGAIAFHRPDMRYVATYGKEGIAPKGTSHILPWSGNAVMRSGWERDALYLCFDGGPLGTNHQHDDKLSFVLSAYGRNFIIDPGPYLYTLDRWREYALSTAAHSTILIDGLGQNRLLFETELEAPKNPHPAWQSNERFDYTNAVYSTGYGSASVPVIHKRHIVFKKPEYWVIVDQIKGQGTYKIESLFHFAPELKVLALNNGSVYTQNGKGPTLSIIPVDCPGLDVSILKGREKPSLQGWYTPDEKHRKAAPVVSYQLESELPVTLVYLLLPERGAETPTAAIEAGWPSRNTLDIRVDHSEGRTDRIRIYLADNRAELTAG